MKSTFLVAVLWLSACGTPEVTSSTEEALFTITSVQLDTGAVQTEFLTGAEVARMLTPRATVRSAGGVGVSEQAIGVDSPCTGSSLVLNDNTVSACTLSGCNMICFSGSGTADLSTYCRTSNHITHQCTGWWNQNVRSYDPNGNSGKLYGIYCGDAGCYNYSTDGWVDAPGCGAGANFANIGGSC